MGVLHITPTLLNKTSGLATAVQQMCLHLHRQGQDITVASVEDPPSAGSKSDIPWRHFEGPRVISSRPTRWPILNSWRFAPGLERLIDQSCPEPPKAVHVHGLWLYPQWLGKKLARNWRCPLIITLHGMLEPWRTRHRAWKKLPMWWLLDRRTIAAAELLIATSEQEAEHLFNRGLKNAVEIIPLGVEVPPEFTAKTKKTHTPEKRQALLLSRLHPAKGVSLLIQAVAQIKPEEWHFVIAGPSYGNYVEQLQSEARESGVTSWFTFKNEVTGEDKWRLYQASDLFVLPSYNENFGLVVAESLACGVPVITTTETPWKKLPMQGCGWVCEPELNNLTDSLRQALSLPPDALQTMGEKGASWVSREFSWQSCARSLAAVYERVA